MREKEGAEMALPFFWESQFTAATLPFWGLLTIDDFHIMSAFEWPFFKSRKVARCPQYFR
jgi:hypothetical protein